MNLSLPFNVNTYVKIKPLEMTEGFILSIKICGITEMDRWYHIRYFHEGKPFEVEFMEQELVK